MKKQELDEKITEVSKSIFSYCMLRTSTRADAEDLSQEILYELIKSAPNIREDKAFYGFMWSVAGNVYKQWCRKKLRTNECQLTEDIPTAGEDFPDLEENTDIYLLRRELSLLSRKYRSATILYYLDHKSCAEISQALSISESMVKYLLFKSKKILKEGMRMNRTYGEQSYHPKKLHILYMGEGPNHYYNLIDGSSIRQNILWACYNDRLTEEEIALEIGVSLPYIEEDLNKLTETGLLLREGNYYRTNLIIITDDFKREAATKLNHLQQEIAEKTAHFIDTNSQDIRSIGFYGCHMSQNSLKWQLTCMSLQQAFNNMTDSLYASGKAPVTAFGEHAYVWATEHILCAFNCCTIEAEMYHTKTLLHFMDWAENPQIQHGDFYNNPRFVRLYDKLAHKIPLADNEYEQEIAGELIRKGYAYEKDGEILVTMPIFTKNEAGRIMELMQPLIDEIQTIFCQMNGVLSRILKNHAPSHLRKQIEGIASMCLWDEGVCMPASMLIKNGYLSTAWDVYENATSYGILVE